MKYIKILIGNLYWIFLSILVLHASYMKIIGLYKWSDIFHLAYYIPAVAILSVISAHINLLDSIRNGGEINLKARVYDFIHWLMLIGINVGAWIIGGVTVWWFILKLLLLYIVGWQIGIGLKRHLKLTSSEKKFGFLFAFLALLLGLFSGYIRNAYEAPFGIGWYFETITAIIATLIVIKWIWHDIGTISGKASGYPRSFFLKGLFGNFLIIWFWAHIMAKGDLHNLIWWLQNIGLSFNVIIGNLLFIVYWGIYEYYIKKQKLNILTRD